MADQTPNFGLTKPTVGATSNWAQTWNDNADKIDAAVQSVSQAAASAEADAQSGITKANAAKAAADAAAATANAAMPKAGGTFSGDIGATSVTITANANGQIIINSRNGGTNFVLYNTDNIFRIYAVGTGDVAQFDTSGDLWLKSLGGKVSASLANVASAANSAVTGANNAQATANAAYARMPAGVIADWAGTGSPPAGWLVCNGASISRASYPDLFAAIGDTYGAADGNSFSLPDIRGLFRRAVDDGRGYDSRRAFNTIQGSQNLSHNHGASNGGSFITSGSGANVGGGEYLGVAGGTSYSGGGESRPVNIAFRAIIKY